MKNKELKEKEVQEVLHKYGFKLTKLDIPPSTEAHINAYMKSMDEDIAIVKEYSNNLKNQETINVKNKYIYIIYELYIDDDTPQIDVICMTTNINKFLNTLVSLPFNRELIIGIVDDDENNEYYSHLVFKRYYECSDFIDQRRELTNICLKLSHNRWINVDKNICNIISNYIADFIEKTDFNKLQEEYINERDNRIKENQLKQLHTLADRFGYDLIKKEI